MVACAAASAVASCALTATAFSAQEIVMVQLTGVSVPQATIALSVGNSACSAIAQFWMSCAATCVGVQGVALVVHSGDPAALMAANPLVKATVVPWIVSVPLAGSALVQ